MKVTSEKMRWVPLLVLIVLLLCCSVQVVSASGGYAYTTQWNGSGLVGGKFIQPYGIAVDSAGTVYVTDMMNHRIQTFTSSSGFISKWGSTNAKPGSENGNFSQPSGIAVDSVGTVYVADTMNHRIQQFNSTGGFIMKWGIYGTGDGQFNQPHGVAVDSAGDVYVTDTFNQRIQKFNSTGGFITKWGNPDTTSLSGDGRFNQPTGIAVDRGDNVYVTDLGNHRIQKFNSTGGYITKWGSYGSGDGQFAQPSGIAVDSAGTIYVTDAGFPNRVQKFNSTGGFITKWGGYGKTGDGQLNQPTGIAVDTDGNVNVADQYNNRIQVFAPEIPPAADFTANVTAGPVPLIVGFTDTSTGSVRSWRWSFGDETTSIEQNPVHAFNLPGVYNVSLTTINAYGDTTRNRTGYIDVISNPSISSVSPASAAGSGPATLTLNGLDFYEIQNVNLTRAGSANLTTSAITYLGGRNTSVACVFNLAGAEPGLWSVNLTDARGATASKADVFTVNSTPVIFVLAPREGTHGSTLSPSPTILGTGFIDTPSPATVLLTAPDNSTATMDCDWVNSTSISFTFPFLTAEPGTWQVRVKNGDGQVSNKMPLVVHDGGVVPLFTTNTTSGNNPLTVQFTNASTGYVRSFSWNFGDGSPVNTTESNPSHTFTTPGDFTVNLTVFNNNNTAGVNASTEIQVISVPAITGCTPASGKAGSPACLHISGQQFMNPGNLLRVNLTRGEEQNITGTVGSVTLTGIGCTFTIPADAKPGDWTLVVTNADDTVATWSGTFKILSNPSITTITPVSGVADGRTVSFTLAGTGFFDHPAPLAVNLIKTGQPPITAMVSSSDQTTISGRFTLPTGTATGAWTVMVTNGDGQTAQLPGAFTVSAPPAPPAPPTPQPTSIPPRISAITPSSGMTSSAVPIVVDGSHFQTGIALYLVRDGSRPIVATVLQTTGTQISGVFSLAGAGTGPWNVLVVNPDGDTGARSEAFTVTTPAPTTPAPVNTTPVSTTPLPVNTTPVSTTPLPVNTTPVTTPAPVNATPVSTTPAPVNTTPVSTTPIPVNTTPVTTPAIGFSANVTAGLSPLMVQFNGSTTGSVQYYYWLFGDGSASLDQNPVHVYDDAGNYTVSLYALGLNGTQVKTIEHFINVTSPLTPTPTVTMTVPATTTVTPTPTSTGQSLPVANFTVTPQGSPGSMGVRVTDTSVNATSVQYDLGDGTTTAYPNFRYTYWRAGTYTIKLIATSAAGSSIKTIAVTVPSSVPVTTQTVSPIVTTPTPTLTTVTPTPTGPLPVANFTVTAGAPGPMGILVTDASVNATSVRYDLGDGTTTAYRTFRYTYWQVGTYTIEQTATNSAGTSKKTIAITVLATVPTTTFPPIGGDQGWYTVHCNVDGATVLFDQIPMGTTAGGILKVRVYTIATPFRTFTVSRDGYTTFLGTITAYPGKDQNVDLTAQLTPAAGQAYNGPHNIPGLLEAEDYDFGGEGVAYHDTTVGNTGGAYRQDDVDIEMLDLDSSPNVGWIRSGEWLTYTVNVTTTGTYDAGFRVASNHSSSNFQVYVDNNTTSVATVNVPNTGDWPVFRTISVPVTLPAGRHRLVLKFPTDFVNINWINFVQSSGLVGIIR